MLTKKKTALCLLVAVFMLSTLLLPASAAYSDVDDNDWYADAVNKWGNLLQADGAIEPGKTVTRGEFVHILNGLLGFGQADPKFTDVKGHKYEKDIGAFEKAGIVVGTAEGVFSPDDDLQRYQAAIMLGRVLGLDKGVDGFNYADSADLAVLNETAAAYQGALNRGGYYNGTKVDYKTANEKVFSPERPFIRAEIFAMVNNMVKGGYINSATAKPNVNAADRHTEGNMIIAASSKINDVSVVGDLIIAPKLGDGEVTLDNVIVTGSLYVRGGGVDSIIITGNSSIGRIVVDNAGSSAVRIAVEGKAVVAAVVVSGGAETEVIITGKVDVVVITASVTLSLVDAEVGDLAVWVIAEIVIDEDSTVEVLEVFNDKVTIDNEGTIELAEVVEGVEITGDGEVEDTETIEKPVNDVYAA